MTVFIGLTIMTVDRINRVDRINKVDTFSRLEDLQTWYNSKGLDCTYRKEELQIEFYPQYLIDKRSNLGYLHE